jgi:hypothetical protein
MWNQTHLIGVGNDTAAPPIGGTRSRRAGTNGHHGSFDRLESGRRSRRDASRNALVARKTLSGRCPARTGDLLLVSEREAEEERVRENTKHAESPAQAKDQQFSFWSGDEPEV